MSWDHESRGSRSTTSERRFERGCSVTTASACPAQRSHDLLPLDRLHQSQGVMVGPNNFYNARRFASRQTTADDHSTSGATSLCERAASTQAATTTVFCWAVAHAAELQQRRSRRRNAPVVQPSEPELGNFSEDRSSTILLHPVRGAEQTKVAAFWECDAEYVPNIG